VCSDKDAGRPYRGLVVKHLGFRPPTLDNARAASFVNVEGEAARLRSKQQKAGRLQRPFCCPQGDRRCARHLEPVVFDRLIGRREGAAQAGR
jgi:hypothetical protein